MIAIVMYLIEYPDKNADVPVERPAIRAVKICPLNEPPLVFENPEAMSVIPNDIKKMATISIIIVFQILGMLR